MRFFCSILILVTLVGCEKVSKENLSLLNGYWEIAEVTFKDGSHKEFKVSPSVDFIKLEGLNGYRKKVQPRFDGTFETSDDAELFAIKETTDRFIIGYRTELSSWSEELTELSANHFSVMNEDGITYSYKRFVPINVQK